jgi:hypothetical protein
MENRPGPFAGLNLESAAETTEFTDGTDGKQLVLPRSFTRQVSPSVIVVGPETLRSV